MESTTAPSSSEAITIDLSRLSSDQAKRILRIVKGPRQIRRATRKRKKWLRPEESKRILELSMENPTYHLLLSLMIIMRLRVGEILGSQKGDKSTLHGLRIEDINWKDAGFWVEGKGYQGGRTSPIFMKAPADLIEEIRKYIGDRTKGLVIHLSRRQANNVWKKHAKMAGVEDWNLVSNHRFRAYGITQAYRKTKDPMATRDLARHRNIQTTNDYIAAVETEEQNKIVEQIAEDLR